MVLVKQTTINVSVAKNSDLPQVTPFPTPPTIKLPKRVNGAEPPQVSATAVYIFDTRSGFVLFEKNADLLVSPASTTKIMTALVVDSAHNAQDIIIVPPFKVEGQKMNLVRNEKISVESLLYGLLVTSANDAAEVLALTFPGGREAFIEAMNMKARRLGLSATVFKNPSGLDAPGHVTTAREMSLLGKFLLDSPRLREIVSTQKASVSSTDLMFTHAFQNTNALLSKIPGVMGIKTGWTEEARENLVTYVSRGNGNVIISLFGSDDRFGETEKLINWVYESYNFN